MPHRGSIDVDDDLEPAISDGSMKDAGRLKFAKGREWEPLRDRTAEGRFIKAQTGRELLSVEPDRENSGRCGCQVWWTRTVRHTWDHGILTSVPKWR
jgi:hypothetical protein